MIRKKNKFYCVKQHDMTDCGPACIVTIAKQYGAKFSISKLREISGTDKDGTNGIGIVKAAKTLGFHAQAARAKEEDLTEEIQTPCIANILTKEGVYHYVVIHEIKKDILTIADPAEGIIKQSKSDFLKVWTGILIFLTPTQSFENVNETKGLFERFYEIMVPQKKLIYNIFLGSLLYTIFGLIGTFFFQYLIDDILSDGLKSTLIAFAIGMILLNLFKILLDVFRNHMVLNLSLSINTSLITKYYKHVIGLPLSFFDTRKVGEILSRLTDARKIMNTVSGVTLSVMIDLVMLLLSGIILFFQNFNLFIVSLLFIPAHLILALAFVKPFQKIHRKEMEKSAEMESYLVESLNGIATIKSLNGEQESNFETEKRFAHLMRASYKAGWMGNVAWAIEGFLNSLSNVVILCIGGFEVINGRMTVGQLVAFNALFTYFFDPVKRLINLIPQLQEAYVASDRLGEVLDLDLENKNEENNIEISELRGAIELKNVSFQYGTRQKILKNINLKVNAGEKVAVVGESGSGKSTLIKLLLKYYTPQEGEILVDGHNIKDINTESLRELIGYVPQDNFLFGATVRENIGFGGSKNINEIIEASEKANAHEFINDLPLRYETPVGERGSRLSGGQKQRVAISRVILKKPKMLILDEATCNLDPSTEKMIYKTIDNFSNGITTFIIAHRISTIKNCDRIVVMNKGEIAEVGTHEELIKLNGSYYELWKSQSE